MIPDWQNVKAVVYGTLILAGSYAIVYSLVRGAVFVWKLL